MFDLYEMKKQCAQKAELITVANLMSFVCFSLIKFRHLSILLHMLNFIDYIQSN